MTARDPAALSPNKTNGANVPAALKLVSDCVELVELEEPVELIELPPEEVEEPEGVMTVPNEDVVVRVEPLVETGPSGSRCG